jgi:hypothetical protein
MKRYITIDSNQELLAVSEDQSSYKIIRMDQLAECAKIRDTYFCRNNNIMFKHFALHCLSAIYKSLDMKTVAQVCDAFILPSTPWAKQISDDKFIVFHEDETNVLIKCGQEIANIRINGTKEMTLPNCQAITTDYELTGTRPIDIETRMVTPTIHWNTSALLQEIPVHHLSKLLETMTRQYPLHIRDIKRAYDIQLAKTADDSALLYHIPGWIVIIILIFCMGATISMIYCAIKKVRNNTPSKCTEQSIELHLMTEPPTHVE